MQAPEGLDDLVVAQVAPGEPDLPVLKVVDEVGVRQALFVKAGAHRRGVVVAGGGRVGVVARGRRADRDVLAAHDGEGLALVRDGGEVNGCF